MNTVQRIVVICVLAVCGAAMTGCLAVVAAGVAGGTVYWMDQKASAIVTGDVLKAVDAAKKCLSDLKITITNSTADKVAGKVDGRLADGRDINIWVDAETDKTSKVQIRVGTLGDKDLSNQIMDKIKAHL